MKLFNVERRSKNIKMRKFLSKTLIALLATLALYGCSSPSHMHDSILKRERPIPLRKLESLVVNTDDSYKIYVEQTEEEGREQIRNLSITNSLEDAWVFIPKKNLWYEVGINSKWNEITIDTIFLYEIMQENDEIVLHHPHPSERFLFLSRGLRPEQAIPSKIDLENMIGRSTGFYRLQPEGNYAEAVVSHYGTIRYELTKLGVHYLSNHKDWIESYVSGIFRILSNNQPKSSKKPLKKILHYVGIMSQDAFIDVTFTP